MSFIVDPESGKLVSDLAGKASVDARVRLLTLRDTRPILPYGMPWLSVKDGDAGLIQSLQGYATNQLGLSPFYEVDNVTISRQPDDGKISLDATLTTLDGGSLGIGITITPRR